MIPLRSLSVLFGFLASLPAAFLTIQLKSLCPLLTVNLNHCPDETSLSSSQVEEVTLKKKKEENIVFMNAFSKVYRKKSTPTLMDLLGIL